MTAAPRTWWSRSARTRATAPKQTGWSGTTCDYGKTRSRICSTSCGLFETTERRCRSAQLLEDCSLFGSSFARLLSHRAQALGRRPHLLGGIAQLLGCDAGAL